MRFKRYHNVYICQISFPFSVGFILSSYRWLLHGSFFPGSDREHGCKQIQFILSSQTHFAVMVILNWGSFSTAKGFLAMSGNIFACHNWDSLLEMLIYILKCIGRTPPTQQQIITYTKKLTGMILKNLVIGYLS